MQTLDDQIIAHLRRLDDAQKRQVLEYVEAFNRSDFDIDAWLNEAERLANQTEESAPGMIRLTSQELLDELREEASEWPRRA